MRPFRLSEELIQVASARLRDSSVHLEANVRRATSDLYYCLFHAVCEGVVEPFGGNPNDPAFLDQFVRLYRHAEHKTIESRAKSVEKKFSPELREFAFHIVEMKNKREDADYNPMAQISIFDVRKMFEKTDIRLRAFWSADPSERAEFSSHLIGFRR